MAQAPTAWTMRNATRAPTFGARAQSTEPTESTITPATKTRRRP